MIIIQIVQNYPICFAIKRNGKVPSIKWKLVKIINSKTTATFGKICLTKDLF